MHVDPYSTHLTSLERALSALPPRPTIVELGPGNYSTPFLRERAGMFYSLEMNSQEWATKCGAEFDPDPEAWRRFVEMRPDLLFVDQGAEHKHMNTRGLAVQLAMDLGMTQIVAHDTEELRGFYGYENIRRPAHYKEEIDFSQMPWTTRWWRAA